MTPDDSGGGKAYQLSRAGFRLDWQCYGRVIMLLDQNHSLFEDAAALCVN